MRVGVVGAGKVGKLRIESVKLDYVTNLAAVLDINIAAAEAAVPLRRKMRSGGLFRRKRSQ